MSPVSSGAFSLAYSLARHTPLIAKATAPFSDVEGTTYVLSEDRLSGYAVRPDGELVFVFSEVPGRGDDLVADAVHRGATRLDCFDGYLVKLYARHGFTVVSREQNWVTSEPDVVFMAAAPDPATRTLLS